LYVHMLVCSNMFSSCAEKKKKKKKKKSSWLVDWLATKSKQKKKKKNTSKGKAEEGRSLFHSHMDLEFKRRRRCQQGAVDLSRWFVTDFQWPNDGERGAATERNKAALTTLGVNVIEESVDAMNVGALLGNCGIDRDQVVLVVIQGMCSRVGADDNDYRKTQHDLLVPPGDGPISCAFAALTAALPRATVMVSATGTGKETVIAKARVRQTATRSVLCREVIYPAPIDEVCYVPQSNGKEYRNLQDPVPLALMAVGPDMDLERLGTKGSKTVSMGTVTLEAAFSGGVLIFLGEFTCTSALHLAKYCCSCRYDDEPLLPKPWAHAAVERMEWGGESYDYEESVAHCAEKLQKKGESLVHLGMHASQLWLYRSKGLHVCNFRAGDEWHPLEAITSISMPTMEKRSG
jgi:hypothetical protein